MAQSCVTDKRTVAGVDMEVLSCGRGDPLVVLHDYEYLNVASPYLEELGERFQVVAPSHPGFGRSSLPRDVESIDDLAYFYKWLLRETFGATPVRVMGLGLGGWIAAEMAVQCPHQFASLVLVDPVGIKISDRTTRDIADTFVVSPDEILRMTWSDPALGKERMNIPGLRAYEEEELTVLLRNRETTAKLAWKPFLYNPKLRARLAHLDVATLVVWGAADHLVTEDYGRAFAASIPDAQFELIDGAGHYPYLERPEEFVRVVTRFLTSQSGEPAHSPALAGVADRS